MPPRMNFMYILPNGNLGNPKFSGNLLIRKIMEVMHDKHLEFGRSEQGNQLLDGLNKMNA